jgi:hypothetical protein
MFAVYPVEETAITEYITGLAGGGVDELVEADGTGVDVVGVFWR